MECPVKIHRVTEDDPSETQKSTEQNSKGEGMTCPITGKKATDIEVLPPCATTEFEETPSIQEYKKLKRVMSMITQFYRNGTRAKQENYETLSHELQKLEGDEKMVRDQIEALEKKPSFQRHPKRKEYLRNLEEELAGLLKQKETFLVKQKQALELAEWSKVIVQVCEWLELNLDDYCINQLQLPIKRETKSVPQLTEKQAKQYSKGLAEITYNLAESQDFFQASLDGRLNKYHNIEKEIIEAQLEVIRKYPEDSPRRLYVESELLRDLEYVQSNMNVDEEALKRREKMLLNHQEYYKVLKFHKDKLKAFGVDMSQEITYDPRFDHYQD